VRSIVPPEAFADAVSKRISTLKMWKGRAAAQREHSFGELTPDELTETIRQIDDELKELGA
jgi:hypothetical protein